MTENQALELVALMVAHYPAQAKLAPDNVMAFASALKAYPLEVSREAVVDLVRTSVYFPSVAAVVSAIVERACAIPQPEAAWLDILRRNTENDWSSPLDPTVKKALRAVGGTHALATSKTYLVRREFLEAYTAARQAVIDRMRETDLPAIARAQQNKLVREGKVAG